MIKIEIIDAAKERPEVLVKVAGFLMELAGHTLVKAPEEPFRDPSTLKYDGCLQKSGNTTDIGDEVAKSELEKRCQAVADEFNNKTHDEIFTGVTAPYQHCGESDLTDFDKSVIADWAPKEVKEETVLEANEGVLAGIDPGGLTGKQEFVRDIPMPPELPPHEFKGGDIEIKPKKHKKPKGKIEIISQTEVTEQSIDLVEPVAAVEEGTIVSIQHENFPSEIAVKQDGKWVDYNESGLGAPVINGNTLIDLILKATTEGKITHEQIVQIVQKHGLSGTKDILTYGHLVPEIYASIQEVLNG